MNRAGHEKSLVVLKTRLLRDLKPAQQAVDPNCGAAKPIRANIRKRSDVEYLLFTLLHLGPQTWG
jgi:hypothetical protein